MPPKSVIMKTCTSESRSAEGVIIPYSVWPAASVCMLVMVPMTRPEGMFPPEPEVSISSSRKSCAPSVSQVTRACPSLMSE